MDDFLIIQPTTHINDVDPDTGQVVPGYRLTVRDGVTGSTVYVFVPDRVFSADNARLLIEQRLQTLREVAAIGGGGLTGG